MRLTKTEIDALIATIGYFLDSHSAELRLYGSRVDDHKKGGDIDLLLLVNTKVLEFNLNQKKHIILAHIYEQIGEQKIDLKITSYPEISMDPFLKHIYPSSVILKTWSQEFKKSV